MLIPAARLKPYLEMICSALGPLPSSSHPIPVKFKSGELWRKFAPADVQAMADAEQVFGTGSESKLKYVTLDVAPADVEETLERAKQATRSQVRERLQNPQSSQTVWNQPITGKLSTFKAFRHIRNEGFGLKARQEYQ